MGGISPASGNHLQLETLARTCLPVVRMFPPQPTVSSGVTCRRMKSVVMLPPCKSKQNDLCLFCIYWSYLSWVTAAAVFERRHLGPQTSQTYCLPQSQLKISPKPKTLLMLIHGCSLGRVWGAASPSQIHLRASSRKSSLLHHSSSHWALWLASYRAIHS